MFDRLLIGFLEEVGVAGEKHIEARVAAQRCDRDAAIIGCGKLIQVAIAQLKRFLKCGEGAVVVATVGIKASYHIAQITIGITIVAEKVIAPFHCRILVA